MDFRAEAAQRVKRVCVSAGKINTDAPKETTGAPSLVLRCLGKQETAWDLAKRYNTTIGAVSYTHLFPTAPLSIRRWSRPRTTAGPRQPGW